MGCSTSKAASSLDHNDVKLVSNILSPRTEAAKAFAAEERRLMQEAAELEAARGKAATRLQAASRGRAGRIRASNEKYPCNSYRVSTKAATFGNCVCGWPKAQHSEDALLNNRSGKDSATLTSPGTLQRKFLQKEKVQCARYEVDLHGADTGSCKHCGMARADHTASALAAADSSNAANLTSPGTLQRRFVQKEKVQCTKYVVDLNATTFGQCVCGSKRDDHTAAALKGAVDSGKENSKIQDERDVRAKFLQRDKVKCRQYEVNLSAGTMGECKNCGAPRREHTAQALAGAADAGKANAKVVDAEMVRKRFVQREEVQCREFQLDMNEGVPFGTCICGQPKSKHSDGAARGAVRAPSFGRRASQAREAERKHMDMKKAQECR